MIASNGFNNYYKNVEKEKQREKGESFILKKTYFYKTYKS